MVIENGAFQGPPRDLPGLDEGKLGGTWTRRDRRRPKRDWNATGKLEKGETLVITRNPQESLGEDEEQ